MFDNQIGIFINGCLNLFHVVCLYVDFLSKYKFRCCFLYLQVS